jgi:hypothetical protein
MEPNIRHADLRIFCNKGCTAKVDVAETS